jgi:uncharacterized protein YodC (DUF2158 family)
MAEFSVGDTVVLKSGGPPMTVMSVTDLHAGPVDEPQYNCAWFDGQRDRERWFPESALKKHDEEEGKVVVVRATRSIDPKP